MKSDDAVMAINELTKIVLEPHKTPLSEEDYLKWAGEFSWFAGQAIYLLMDINPVKDNNYIITDCDEKSNFLAECEKTAHCIIKVIAEPLLNGEAVLVVTEHLQPYDDCTKTDSIKIIEYIPDKLCDCMGKSGFTIPPKLAAKVEQISKLPFKERLGEMPSFDSAVTPGNRFDPELMGKAEALIEASYKSKRQSDTQKAINAAGPREHIKYAMIQAAYHAMLHIKDGGACRKSELKEIVYEKIHADVLAKYPGVTIDRLKEYYTKNAVNIVLKANKDEILDR